MQFLLLKSFFSKNSWLKWLIFFVLIILFSWGIFYYAWSQIFLPLSFQSQFQEFVVERGQSLGQISENLAKTNLIRSAFWFKFYVLGKGWAKHLQAGHYLLSPSMNIPQIAQKMMKGEAIPQEVKVTIPEGFNLKEIAQRLEEANLIKKEDFFNQPLSSEVKKLFQEITQKQASTVKDLEGFLFPDTYKFKKQAQRKEILLKMLNNFNKKMEPFKPEIKKQNKNIFEIVIMASLIEKEVKTDEDRRLVSGIFWKRLAQGKPLESCATIAYILGQPKWRYSFEETRIKSPYNTYLHPGLPPGPINNPGLSAIKAALFPQESEYNYFLTAPDGRTIFSRTLKEHNLNKQKYFH